MGRGRGKKREAGTMELAPLVQGGKTSLLLFTPMAERNPPSVYA